MALYPEFGDEGESRSAIRGPRGRARDPPREHARTTRGASREQIKQRALLVSNLMATQKSGDNFSSHNFRHFNLRAVSLDDGQNHAVNERTIRFHEVVSEAIRVVFVVMLHTETGM